MSSIRIRLRDYRQWLPLAIFAGVSVAYFYIIDGLLPSIMQDELVYQRAAAGQMSMSDLPNYLYFWLYQICFGFGDEFYSAVKSVNLIFHTLSSVLIFSVFRSRFPIYQSLMAGLGFQLSGFMIFNSFFMPEAMYAFLVLCSLIMFGRSRESRNLFLWIGLSGFMIGLAQLTKPHGAFVFILVSIWILVGERQLGLRSRFSAVLVYGGGFILARLGVGIAIAGAKAIDFFGMYIPEGESPVSEINNSLEDPLGLASLLLVNYGQHLIFIICVLAPIVAFFIARNVGFSRNLVFVIFLILGLSFFIAAFESYITIGGDDHTARLLARHYEYLIPVALLTLVFEHSQEFAGTKRTSFSAALALFLFGVGFVVLATAEGFFWSASGYSDSGITTALRTASGVWLLVAVSVGFFWYIARPVASSNAVLYTVILLGIITASNTTIQHVGDNSNFLPSDKSAVYTIQNYPDLEKKRILILGSDKALTEASAFILNAPAEFRVYERGTRLNADETIFDYDLIIQHTDVALVGVEEATFYETGFAVTDVRRIDEEAFLDAVPDTEVK